MNRFDEIKASNWPAVLARTQPTWPTLGNDVAWLIAEVERLRVAVSSDREPA